MHPARVIGLAAILGLAGVGGAAGPQTIRPGEVWPDDRGNHVQAHGRGIIKVGDTYYWFGEDRSQRLDPSRRYVGCYSSKNLVYWILRNQVLRRRDPCTLCWSPKVYYNARTKKLVMFMHIDERPIRSCPGRRGRLI